MSQNNFSINYAHFMNKLENDIIQAVRAFSLEHSIDIDSAKLSVRQTLQDKLNELLTKDEIQGITNIRNEIDKRIENNKDKELMFSLYELLKTFRI